MARDWRRQGTPAGLGSVRATGAYTIVEMLVYIVVVLALLAVGYTAVYRATDYSVALKRSSEDIAAALQAGEKWRADVRLASHAVRVEADGTSATMDLGGSKRIVWRFADEAIFRQEGASGPVRMLQPVKATRFCVDRLEHTTALRWEMELKPRSKGTVRPGRIRPLFTFTAVPPGSLAAAVVAEGPHAKVPEP